MFDYRFDYIYLVLWINPKLKKLELNFPIISSFIVCKAILM